MFFFPMNKYIAAENKKVFIHIKTDYGVATKLRRHKISVLFSFKEKFFSHSNHDVSKTDTIHKQSDRAP